MTTEQNPVKKRPAFYVFMEDKNSNSEKVGAIFLHEKGTGMNIVIGNKRYSAFAPKAKADGEPNDTSEE